MMKKIIAVIGDGKIEKGSLKYQIAYETGKALVQNGYRVQSGGLGGVMEAVFAGAHSAENYNEGDTIALLPSFDNTEANSYADIVIPTGLDILRNAIVANADAVIAIGGGAGTLSEIAMAWSLFRLIIAYDNVKGWSSELAGKRLDERERYPNIEDKIFSVATVEDCLACLKDKINLYSRRHHGIKYKTL